MRSFISIRLQINIVVNEERLRKLYILTISYQLCVAYNIKQAYFDASNLS